MLNSLAARTMTRQLQFRDFLSARIEESGRDRGASVLEMVVIGAGVFILAVALIAVITNVVGGYQDDLVAP